MQTVPAASALDPVEHLEPRLCLGSLLAAPPPADSAGLDVNSSSESLKDFSEDSPAAETGDGWETLTHGPPASDFKADTAEIPDRESATQKQPAAAESNTESNAEQPSPIRHTPVLPNALPNENLLPELFSSSGALLQSLLFPTGAVSRDANKLDAEATANDWNHGTVVGEGRDTGLQETSADFGNGGAQASSSQPVSGLSAAGSLQVPGETAFGRSSAAQNFSPPAAGETQDTPAGTGDTSGSSPSMSVSVSVSPLTVGENGSTGSEDTVETDDTTGSAVALPQAWFNASAEPITVKYDFRSQSGAGNRITEDQQARAVDALNAWSRATGGRLQFVNDTLAPASEILNIGTGDLAVFGFASGPGGTLSLGGGRVTNGDSEQPTVSGIVWLDQAETWDTTLGNGNPDGTFDYFTVAAHEIGHVLGAEDVADPLSRSIMNGVYGGERSESAIATAVHNSSFFAASDLAGSGAMEFPLRSMTTGPPQLSAAEVEQLLDRASAVTPSEDAIIAVVDRGGHILGVRTEAGVAAPDDATLVFMIDGAVAKARTAAFFSNGDPANGTLAPLTSRTIRFLSQSTITQREVESNPNSADPTVRGPGFVGPVGLGGHFPPGILHTPPVDLFAIEHTNRDSIVHPGEDRVKGTADDVLLRSRFNADPTFITAGQEIDAPESYGFVSGRLPEAQSRGMATLPGGIPLFRDTNGDGLGDTLIGGIGVFFPGPDGFATHEQGFVAGVGQTEAQRTNAARVLEAEYIAFAAAGGSLGASAPIGTVGGVSTVASMDLPFGRLDLVGITLEIFGPIAGPLGVEQLVQFGTQLGPGVVNGTDQPLDLGGDGVVGGGDDTLFADGQSVPEGWLVEPHASAVDDITAGDVRRIIDQGIAAANQVRAAVRLPLSSRTRMVLSVTDTTGEVLGLYRMRDATFFSLDVATAKARNTAYYADAGDLEAVDRVPGVSAGVAFSNRTFRFLSEPRFPSGVDGTPPPVFSILTNPSIDPLTGENIGAPAAASTFDSVLGFDAFNPNSNFRDAGDAGVVADATNPMGVDTRKANQNGVVFFPGSIPLYKAGRLVGGLGVSGDGVDQDDVVTFIASQGYLPPSTVLRADQVKVDGVRLPFIKFLRNPFG